MSRLAWVICALFIILRVLLDQKIIVAGTDIPTINTPSIAIIGGFMTFFLVFFLGQTYNRFLVQFETSRKIEGELLNLSIWARVALPPVEAWRLIRYVNAVHILGYIGLGTAYTDENFFVELNKKHGFLTDVEVARLRKIDMDVGGSAHQEVLVWATELLYQFFHQPKTTSSANIASPIPAMNTMVDTNTLRGMIGSLLTIRSHFATLYYFGEQSIPLSYLHLTVIMNFIYLILISYTIAVFIPADGSIFPHLLGALMVVANIIFVIGIRELGNHMIDPYGNDLHDLAVMYYIENTFLTSRRILNAHRFASPGMSTENYLESIRPSCGTAYHEDGMPPMYFALNGMYTPAVHSIADLPILPNELNGGKEEGQEINGELETEIRKASSFPKELYEIYPERVGTVSSDSMV